MDIYSNYVVMYAVVDMTLHRSFVMNIDIYLSFVFTFYALRSAKPVVDADLQVNHTLYVYANIYVYALASCTVASSRITDG